MWTCWSLTAYASKEGTKLWNSLLICQVCYSYKHTEMPRVADGCWWLLICWSLRHAKWNFKTSSGNFRKSHGNKERSIERAKCRELSWTTKSYIELLKHTSGILGQVTAPAFLGTWHYIPGNTARWHPTNPKNLLKNTGGGVVGSMWTRASTFPNHFWSPWITKDHLNLHEQATEFRPPLLWDNFPNRTQICGQLCWIGHSKTLPTLARRNLGSENVPWLHVSLAKHFCFHI